MATQIATATLVPALSAPRPTRSLTLEAVHALGLV